MGKGSIICGGEQNLSSWTPGSYLICSSSWTLMVDVQGMNASYKWWTSRGWMPLISALVRTIYGISILMMNHGMAAVMVFWLSQPSVCLYSVAMLCTLETQVIKGCIWQCWPSLRSRQYSRARENGKLEIPPAQKLHILSSPAAGWRSILIGQNVDFEFLIDRSIKELE
jgi:hypothetical protein